MMRNNDFYIENTCELAETMINFYEKRVCESVCCVADYDIIRNLLTDLILLSDGGFSIMQIELEDPEYNNYDKEYILTLYDDEIWLEKAYFEEAGIYMMLEDTVLFIHNNCNSKIIDQAENSTIICFDDCVDDICDCCENCNCFKSTEEDCEDDMHGFSFRKDTDEGFVSYAFYSNDKELVAQARQELMNK